MDRGSGRRAIESMESQDRRHQPRLSCWRRDCPETGWIVPAIVCLLVGNDAGISSLSEYLQIIVHDRAKLLVTDHSSASNSD